MSDELRFILAGNFNIRHNNDNENDDAVHFMRSFSLQPTVKYHFPESQWSLGHVLLLILSNSPVFF